MKALLIAAYAAVNLVTFCLYGADKRILGRAESSALTGKGLTYGGSKIRQEAAGFGTVYFLARMLEHQGESMDGKRIAVSGFGNMSWGVW